MKISTIYCYINGKTRRETSTSFRAVYYMYLELEIFHNSWRPLLNITIINRLARSVALQEMYKLALLSQYDSGHAKRVLTYWE